MKNTLTHLAIFALLIGMASCGDKKSDDKKDDKNSEKKTEASAKGKWSEDDLKKAMAAIKETEDELESLGEYKQEYIDCYLSKIESNYDSFDDANLDYDGCFEIASECAESILEKMDPLDEPIESENTTEEGTK